MLFLDSSSLYSVVILVLHIAVLRSRIGLLGQVLSPTRRPGEPPPPRISQQGWFLATLKACQSFIILNVSMFDTHFALR